MNFFLKINTFFFNSIPIISPYIVKGLGRNIYNIPSRSQIPHCLMVLACNYNASQLVDILQKPFLYT